MKYLFLSEIGESYHTEVGKSGHRSGAFAGLENKLKVAIADLCAARQSLAPQGASFQDKKRFFENKSDPAKIAALEAKVLLRKNWLTRQGAVVDADGNVDEARSARVVEYDDNLAKQGLTRLHLVGGRAFTDAACTRPFDTRDMVTQFSGPGKAIFVMGRTGNLHVSSHAVGYRHHSSLLAGTNVSSAGELEASKGTITWLSNKSGHYFPSVIHLLQVLHQLQKHNVPMTFPLRVFPSDDSYPSVAAFLSALDVLGEAEYELAKLMQYTFDDTLLAQNGWRWRAKDSEKPGVYTIATSQPVPHKTVRQWLKGRGNRGQVAAQSGAGR
jgi:hypothetical protein